MGRSVMEDTIFDEVQLLLKVFELTENKAFNSEIIVFTSIANTITLPHFQSASTLDRIMCDVLIW